MRMKEVRYLSTKRSNDRGSSLWFTRSLTLRKCRKEKKKPPYSFDIDVLVLFDAEGGALPFLSHKLFTVEPPR